MYYDGQIIQKSEYKAFANWNNANDGKFDIEPIGNGEYKITEIVIPEPNGTRKSTGTHCGLKSRDCCCGLQAIQAPAWRTDPRRVGRSQGVYTG